MKRRFVIFVQTANFLTRNAITNYFKNSQFGYWSWIDNCWLIVDYSGQTSAETLRSIIGELAPNQRQLVIAVEHGREWSGFGPRQGDQNMFEWIHTCWEPD